MNDQLSTKTQLNLHKGLSGLYERQRDEAREFAQKMYDENKRLKAEREWISVENRTPENGDLVNVIYERWGKKRVSSGFIDEDDGWYVDRKEGNKFSKCNSVILWQPLPKPSEQL